MLVPMPYCDNNTITCTLIVPQQTAPVFDTSRSTHTPSPLPSLTTPESPSQPQHPSHPPTPPENTPQSTNPDQTSIPPSPPLHPRTPHKMPHPRPTNLPPAQQPPSVHHPLSLHYQCAFCNRVRIVVKTPHHYPAQHNNDTPIAPAPTPTGTCLIRTGDTWRHPVFGELPGYIEGGECRYQRMDLDLGGGKSGNAGGSGSGRGRGRGPALLSLGVGLGGR